jgi:hypothetical protein
VVCIGLKGIRRQAPLLYASGTVTPTSISVQLAVLSSAFLRFDPGVKGAQIMLCQSPCRCGSLRR